MSIDENSKKGLLKQIDEWFGRQHRVYFFLAGIVISWVLVSIIFIPIANKKMASMYEFIIEERENEIGRLNKANSSYILKAAAYQDSIEVLSDFGIRLSTTQINLHDNFKIPLFGNDIKCSIFPDVAEEGFDIQFIIDTCPPREERVISKDSLAINPCYKLLKSSHLNVHQYCPLYLKGKEYLLYCAEADDSTATLVLYRTKE